MLDSEEDQKSPVDPDASAAVMSMSAFGMILLWIFWKVESSAVFLMPAMFGLLATGARFGKWHGRTVERSTLAKLVYITFVGTFLVRVLSVP